MGHEVLEVRLTMPGGGTLPGGMCLRYDEAHREYQVHSFTRPPGSREPDSYFWGHYTDSRETAYEAFNAKVARAAELGRMVGGALIPEAFESRALHTEHFAAHGFFAVGADELDADPALLHDLLGGIFGGD